MRFSLRLALVVVLCNALFATPSRADPQEDVSHFNRWVTSVAYSADGKQLYSVGGESLLFRPGDMRIWDAATGKLSANLEGATSCLWSVARSSDGKKVAAASYDGKVFSWDTTTNKLAQTFQKHKGWVRCVATPSDGACLASAGDDGMVNYVLADGSEKSFKAHESMILALAFSPDGKTLATASSDKTVKLWDWKEGKETGKLPEHGDSVWAVVWSPSGAMLATAGADRKIRLFNPAGQEQGVLEGHRDWVTSLAFQANGEKLASGSLDRTVRIWNVSEKKEESKIENLTESVWSVAYSPDGQSLALGTHGGVFVFRASDRQPMFPLPSTKAGEVEKK